MVSKPLGGIQEKPGYPAAQNGAVCTKGACCGRRDKLSRLAALSEECGIFVLMHVFKVKVRLSPSYIAKGNTMTDTPKMTEFFFVIIKVILRVSVVLRL